MIPLTIDTDRVGNPKGVYIFWIKRVLKLPSLFGSKSLATMYLVESYPSAVCTPNTVLFVNIFVLLKGFKYKKKFGPINVFDSG